MKKLYIEDMSLEELEKVFHANEKLRNEVVEDMVDTEMHYISEQLDYIRGSLSDWSVGPYSYNYLHIRDSGAFIDGVEDIERSIPILIDEDTPLLKKAVAVLEDYRNTDAYTDEFDELEERVEKLAEELSGLVLKRFEQTLEGCYDEEHQLHYFTEFYAESRLDEGCYIDGEDFILKEDVVKTYN